MTSLSGSCLRSGRASGARGNSCSARRCSTVRLVTTIFTCGQAASSSCFLKCSKTCVPTLQYLLQRASFHLTCQARAVHPPQANFRPDEATTGTPTAHAVGLHVLVL